jgi:23S rRNA pseudouridine2605 synthase
MSMSGRDRRSGSGSKAGDGAAGRGSGGRNESGRGAGGRGAAGRGASGGSGAAGRTGGAAGRGAGRGGSAGRGAAPRGGAGQGGAGRGGGPGGSARGGAGRDGAGPGGGQGGSAGGGASRGNAGLANTERGVNAGSRPGWVRAWGVDAELAPVRDFNSDFDPESDRPEDYGEDFDTEFGIEGERDSLIDVPGGVRLQKVLAAAGIGSRRHCEEMIGEGRVAVDGEIVRRFGARVDPDNQIIRVDGKRIAASEKLVYVALNKPPGVLTTMSDTRGRATIADVIGERAERLFHVGRLDYETEGLMLLMNDGELAHRLAHPRYGVLKTYLADIPGPLPKDLGRQLMSGVELDDGVATADRFRVIERAGARALVEVTLHEGRKHIVRRMLAEVGHPVSRLVRTQVGPVMLGNLRTGATRRLTSKEVGDLYAAVGL